MSDVVNEKMVGKRNFWIAFGLQFVVLLVCIVMHRIFIHLGGMIGKEEMVGDEMTNPTVGRLVFALLAFVMFAILSCLASKKAKESKIFTSFILGTFAGTLLWQSMGEDMWNFSIGGEHFIPLEGISVLPMAVLFVLALIYCYKNNSLDWGIWCMVLGFAVNWFGHYVLIGIYPIFAGLCSEALWCKAIGLGLGIILFVVGVFLGMKKSKTQKEMILSAILSFYAIGILAFGMVES